MKFRAYDLMRKNLSRAPQTPPLTLAFDGRPLGAPRGVSREERELGRSSAAELRRVGEDRGASAAAAAAGARGRGPRSGAASAQAACFSVHLGAGGPEGLHRTPADFSRCGRREAKSRLLPKCTHV